MSKRSRYAPPAGRRTVFVAPVRLKPDRVMDFPYETVVAEPARWPAGDWQKRLRLARPLRRLAGGIDAFARLVSGPLRRLADQVEGQPLVWWCEAEGWVQKRGMRDGRWRSWWVYEGPVTPSIREMFAAHPERFADSSPAVLYQLRVGQ